MNKKRLLSVFLNIGLLVMLFAFAAFDMGGISNSEVSYDEFLTMVDDGKVEFVEIGTDELKIKLIDENKTYYTGYVEYNDLVNKLYDSGVSFTKAEEKSSGIGSLLLSFLFSFGPLILLFWMLSKMQGGGSGNSIFNVGKSKATLNINKNTGVTFADVAGQEEAKEQLTEIIDYLHNPKKYQAIGAKIPKGALLVGPPGTGKTLLAKAIAGEAGVPFFSVTGSDFIEMYVGVGASRIRDLFEQAKQHAPCIIFIDEVDSIAKSRDAGARNGSNDEREQTLNQLLSEMDGFDSSKGIIILAATNRPESLDKAFLRAGRFDRKVIVERPDFKGRVETLKVHSKNVKLDSDVDFKAIAYATTGSVGADLENIVNEAALRAVKLGRKAVTQEDLMEAVETVFAGKEKKDRVMSDKEKQLVAYHEVGHAVVSALLKNTSPVQKITIVPRTKGSLGYTLQVPEEEKFLSNKDEMIDEITTFLGGRAAEEIIFKTVTTGASNDIERATEIATQMITIYGMSDKFDMMALESIQNRYLDGYRTRNCSESTSTIIDQEILSIIKECHEKAKNIIKNNRKLMDEVAGYLLSKESITGDEFMSIFKKYYPEKEMKIPVAEDFDKPVKKEGLGSRFNKEENPLNVEKEPEKPKVSESVKKEIPLTEIPIVVKTEPVKEHEENMKQKATTKSSTEKPVKEEPKKEVKIEPPKQEAQKVEEKPQEDKPKAEKPKEEKPIRIDRPSASVLGPKKEKQKNKQKNKNKATASDMQNLLDSVQKQAETPKKKKLYEESAEEIPEVKETKSSVDDIPAESAGIATKSKREDYANDKDDMDDITEDMF